MSSLVICNRLGRLGMVLDRFYSQAALWEACWGVPFRGYYGLYRFSPARLEKMDFYVMVGIMRETGLPLGWRD